MRSLQVPEPRCCSIERQGHRFTGHAGPIAKRAPLATLLLWVKEGRVEVDRLARAAKARAMTNERIAPQDCSNMAEVRAGVDSVDRALARLIAERFRYMDAAARIKTSRSTVRDETRKAAVIAKARANAADAGYDPKIAATLWETLVEASIAYEFGVFDRLKASAA